MRCALLTTVWVLALCMLSSPATAQEDVRWTLEKALSRIPDRELPDFWIGQIDGMAARLDELEEGVVRTIAISPGGHAIYLVAYGDHEPVAHRANFNSAMGAKDPAHYVDKKGRERPVLLFIGPVHGHEVEGLTGLMNLMEIMETGHDLAGRDQSEIRQLGRQLRLLIIPSGNPDGTERFLPRALHGMTQNDIEFWGQGTWSDSTLIDWPWAKQQHPMVGDNVGFLGCYFDDAGVNPMHDEFFHPMGPEAPAVLDVARVEGPDLAVSLHSHAGPPAFYRPAFVPLEVQQQVRELLLEHNRMLASRGLPVSSNVFEPQAETGTASFNLSSAVYHVSGALSFLHETPHGVPHHRIEQDISLLDILDIQLTLYEAMMRIALERKRIEKAAAN